MSYEGHVQALCANGHYLEFDCYFEPECCPTCSAEIAWQNGVDNTNGQCFGEIPQKVFRENFLVQASVSDTCQHCQHTRQVSPDIYRIPDPAEAVKLQHYYPDGYGTEPVPIETIEAE